VKGNTFCPQTAPSVGKGESMLKIDLFLEQAQSASPHQARMLRDFSQLIHDQPEMLPRLAELVQSRLAVGNHAASIY
jgi:hypothetical protein